MLEQQFTCMKSSWDVQCTLDTRWMVGWLPKRAPQKVIIFLFVTKNVGMPKDSSSFLIFLWRSFNFYCIYSIFLQFTCTKYLFTVAIMYRQKRITHMEEYKNDYIFPLYLYIVNVNSLKENTALEYYTLTDKRNNT